MDKLTWWLIAGLACADIVLALTCGIGVDYMPILPLLCIAVGLAFTRLWPNPYIATFATAVAQFELALVSAGVFNYLSIALGFPPIDAELDALDRAHGIDWRALWSFVVDHPWLRTILGLFYSSLAVQIAILVVAFTATRRFERVRELAALTSVTLVVCVLVAAVVPADGAWGYYGISGETDGTLPLVRGIRSGEVTTITFLHGAVTFPSWHTVMAIVLVYVTRGVPWLLLPAVFLNAGMLVATPMIGGHYFVDIYAGVAVAAAAIYAMRSTFALAKPSTNVIAGIGTRQQN